MRKAFGVPIFVLSVVTALALFCTSAMAQITVGQLAPPNTPVECNEPELFDEVPIAVASGASYAVPAPGGVITSWSTRAGAGAGQSYEMKVFRPTGPGSYLVVAHDGPRPLAPSVLNTFPVSIPIQAGDVVGIQYLGLLSTPTACFFETGNVLDRAGWREGNTPDGGAFSLEEENTAYRLNVSATVLPPPVLTGIATPGGTVKGGTPVIIGGANLAEVRAVSFGATPATFTVNSETQITAVAPPSKTLAKVPVTVTTVAGTATSASTFSYEGCKVPKLANKKLKPSKKALKKGDCKLGKVKKQGDATAKTGKVVKQNPKPGKILAPGAKVTIKLG